MWNGDFYLCMITQIYKCLKLYFLLVHNLNEVDKTDLLGILFKIYTVVLSGIDSNIEE